MPDVPLIASKPELVPLGFSSIPVPRIRLAKDDPNETRSGEARETY